MTDLTEKPKELPPRQKEMVKFIRLFRENWGVYASVADLIKAGFGSRQNIRYMLWILKDKGYVDFVYINEKMRGVKVK